MQRVIVHRSGLRRALASLLFVVGFAGSAAAAEQCPVSDAAISKAGGVPQAVTAAMTTEFSCEGAYRILDACQLNTSGDNALSDIVLKKCEPRFLPKATPAIKASYEKARAKCTSIALKKEGSMYQGLAAVCLARAGRDFAAKYGTKR